MEYERVFDNLKHTYQPANPLTPYPVPRVLYQEVTAVAVCIVDIQEAEEVITDASEGEIRLVVCVCSGQLKVGLR